MFTFSFFRFFRGPLNPTFRVGGLVPGPGPLWVRIGSNFGSTWGPTWVRLGVRFGTGPGPDRVLLHVEVCNEKCQLFVNLDTPQTPLRGGLPDPTWWCHLTTSHGGEGHFYGAKVHFSTIQKPIAASLAQLEKHFNKFAKLLRKRRADDQTRKRVLRGQKCSSGGDPAQLCSSARSVRFGTSRRLAEK